MMNLQKLNVTYEELFELIPYEDILFFYSQIENPVKFDHLDMIPQTDKQGK